MAMTHNVFVLTLRDLNLFPNSFLIRSSPTSSKQQENNSRRYEIHQSNLISKNIIKMYKIMLITATEYSSVI